MFKCGCEISIAPHEASDADDDDKTRFGNHRGHDVVFFAAKVGPFTVVPVEYTEWIDLPQVDEWESVVGENDTYVNGLGDAEELLP